MCTPMFFTRSAQLASITYMSRLRALWQASFNATKRGSFLPQVRTFLLCSLSKFGSFPWWNTQCVDVLCIIFGAVEPFNDNHIRCSQGHGSLPVSEHWGIGFLLWEWKTKSTSCPGCRIRIFLVTDWNMLSIMHDMKFASISDCQLDINHVELSLWIEYNASFIPYAPVVALRRLSSWLAATHAVQIWNRCVACGIHGISVGITCFANL